MKIEISGKIKKPDTIQPHDMVSERVYQFGNILAVETSMGEVIAADTDDKQVNVFGDTGEFDEWLSNNDLQRYGIETDLELVLNFVARKSKDLF